MRPLPVLIAAALLVSCAGAPPQRAPTLSLEGPPETVASSNPTPTVAPITTAQVAVPPTEVAASGTPCAEDRHILACRRAPIDSPKPIWLALATSSAEIAIAWVTGSSGGNKSKVAYLARFRPDLTFLGQVSHPTAGNPTGVTIAALPQGGWLLAVTTAQSVEVHPIGPDGQSRGGTVQIQDGAQNLHAPQLLGRPNGAPLLLWSGWGDGKSSTTAAFLDENGHERVRIPLFTNIVEPHLTNSVFAGDAFLVAARVGSAGTIARVELDGRVGPLVAPIGSSNEYHQLAWTGSGARMTYCDFGRDPLVRWASLDRAGAIVSGPLTIGRSPDYYDPAPIVAIGEDTLVLLGGYTAALGAASRLDLLRLDRSGRAIAKPWALLGGGQQHLTDYGMAPLGKKVALAWLEGSPQSGSPAESINLAVIAP